MSPVKMPPNITGGNISGKKEESDMENEGDTDDSDSVQSNIFSNGIDVPIPPDGGWGWVIVFASFICNGLVDGLCSTFGVFLPEFLSYFQESQAKTALAGSLLPGLFLVSGPIASALVNLFGCRAVTILGGIIIAGAFILSTFSPNVNILILTYGIIGGIGVGFIYLPAMVMVGYYFEKHRAVAIGISCSGSGFGMLVLAPTAAALLGHYDWKNALYIIAGIALQSLVMGSLMRPLELTRRATVSTDLGTASDELLPPPHDQMEENETCTDATPLAPYQSNGCVPVEDNTSQNSLQLDVMKQEDVVQQKYLPSNTATHDELYKKALHNNMMARQNQPQDYDSPTFLRQKLQGTHIKMWEENQVPHMTQSCYELPTATPKSVKKRLQPLMAENVGEANGRIVVTDAHTMSCYNLFSSNRHSKDGSKKEHFRNELLKPLNRKDVFFSGSLHTLPEYRSQPTLESYRASVTVIPQLSDIELDSSKHCACIPRDVKNALNEMLDVSVLYNPYFIIICLGNFFIQIGYFIPIMFIATFASSYGIDPKQGASLISAMGISNALGRALAGALANIPRVNSLHLNNLTLIMAGMTTIIAPWLCNSLPTFIAYASIFGLNIAAFVPLSSIFLVQYLGLEKLTNAFGLLSLVRGFSTMVGPPIAGMLIDATDSYELTFMFAGLMFVLAGLVHYLLPVVDKLSKKQEPLHSPNKKSSMAL